MLTIIIHTIIGYAMAFLGLLSPGLLSMTILNTAIDRGKFQARLFAFGVTVPIVVQAHIALLGAEYFKRNPDIIQSFSSYAVVIFWLLSIIFFRQFLQRNQRVKSLDFDVQNSFLYGLIISAINPLAIPFYFTYSTLLEMQGILLLQQPNISFFVLGAVLGALSIMLIYARNAKLLLGKIQFIAKYFKLILAISMFVMGVLSLLSSTGILNV